MASQIRDRRLSHKAEEESALSKVVLRCKRLGFAPSPASKQQASPDEGRSWTWLSEVIWDARTGRTMRVCEAHPHTQLSSNG